MVAMIFDPKSVDCCFHVHDPSTSLTSQYNAHRRLLSLFSPVLARIFSDEALKTEPIAITHVSGAAVEIFLKYFYESAVQLTMELAAEILTLAMDYEVAELIGSCTTYLCSNVTCANALELLATAERYKIDQLASECSKFIAGNAEPIVMAPTFLTCSVSAVKAFLQLPKQCAPTVLFDRCLEWAYAKRIAYIGDDVKLADLRTKLADCLKIVPFQQMGRDAFVDRYEKLRTFVDADEANDILLTLLKSTVTRLFVVQRNGVLDTYEFTFAAYKKLAPISNCIRLKLSKSMTLQKIIISNGLMDGKPIPFKALITVKRAKTQLFHQPHEFSADCIEYRFPCKILFEEGGVYDIRVCRLAPVMNVFIHSFKRKQVRGVEIVPIMPGSSEENTGGTLTSIASVTFDDFVVEEIIV